MPTDGRQTQVMTGGRVAAAATLVLAVLVGAASSRFRTTYGSVVLLCTVLQAAICWALVRRSGRFLSVCGIFAVLWLLYFPVRLLQLMRDHSSVHLYQAVETATDERLVAIWLMTTGAFLAFFVGVQLRRRSPRGRIVDESTVTYGNFLSIGVLGTLLRLAMAVLGINSGILQIVSSVDLFGVAGASCIERRDRRSPAYVSLALVVVQVVLGYRTGFKEAALLPVASWLVGRIAGGQRVRAGHVVLGVVALVLTFGAVQGQRNDERFGRSESVYQTVVSGLTRFDLAYGVPREVKGLDVASNAFGGVLYRLKGADYLIAIRDSVPSRVPFQGGRSLYQPVIATVPAYSRFVSIRPEFSQLSLGRYVTTELIADSIETGNPSSQSMTFPGDLYLNFGTVGVVVGMALVGLLFASFDRAVPVLGPVSAGIFVVAGMPLVAVDRNLAYVFFTSALGLGVVLVVIALLAIGRSPADVDRAEVADATPYRR